MLSSKSEKLSSFTFWFLVLFGTYYWPIESNAGFGIIKISLMVLIILIYFFTFERKLSRALICGSIYLGFQALSILFHHDSFRASTVFFSVGLVLTYISFYHLIYELKALTIDRFLQLIVFMIRLLFCVCIVQQIFILMGIRYLPIINIIGVLGRGIGCNSLSLEPSTFARTMLVLYYAYIKCHEYKRGQGAFTIRELFAEDHRTVTLFFLWMMITMGSATAFVCLILLSLYFLNSTNWMAIIPLLLIIYFFLLPLFPNEQLDRALSIGNAMTSFDQSEIQKADGSGASRISPIINSFHADFSQFETWFGHGVDYAKNHNLFFLQKSTLFDDYGLLFYFSGLLLNLCCAYRINSLGAVFMILGVGGGAGSNIQYSWMLMMFMTCVRYFHDNSGGRTNDDDTVTLLVVDAEAEINKE